MLGLMRQMDDAQQCLSALRRARTALRGDVGKLCIKLRQEL